MSQVTERVAEQMETVAVESRQFVEDHAMQSALVAFGVGVGAGLAVAGLLSGAMPREQRTVTERLGQQMLDAMSRVLPDSFMKS